MAQTSPDNLWSPDPGSNANVPVATAAMQDTVQAALNRRSGTGIAFRNSSISKPSTITPSQSPLSNFTVSGTTVASTSNGFRILEDGIFVLSGRATFGIETGGTLVLAVQVNGSSANSFVHQNSIAENYTSVVTMTTINSLSAGDIITLASGHTSGGPTGVRQETSARLTVTKLA